MDELLRGEALERYIQTVYSGKRVNKRFEIARYRNEVIFSGLDEGGHEPELVLRSLIHELIERTKRDAQKDGIKPQKIAISIKADDLPQDIYLFFRPIDEITPDAVVNLFAQVEQSNKTADLYRKLIRFDATVRGEHFGGCAEYTQMPLIQEGIVQIYSNDNLCLIRSVELARYLNMKHLSTQKQREYIRTSVNRIDHLVDRLLARVKILRNLDFYPISKYCPLLENHYNRFYGKEHRCRITIFESRDPKIKPIYQGKTLNVRHELAIFYHDSHFDVISNINTFFGIRNYCFSCCAPFRCKQDHTVRCSNKCNKCAQMGAGQCEYETDANGLPYINFCASCGTCFGNRECERYHILNNMCQLFKVCTSCDKRYSTKKPHKCGEKYCLTCFKSHLMGECFITRASVKPQKKPYLIYAYDFETMQTTQIEENAFEHEVVYTAAYRCCTQCVDQNSWSEGQFCEFCATKQRMYAWNGVENESLRPLEEFVHFLVRTVPYGSKAVVYAHFASRFDLILVIGELFRQNLTNLTIIDSGNKVYQLTLKAPLNRRKLFGTIIFKDFYLLSPCRLELLPQTYGLTALSKDFFPYLYVRREFFHLQRETLPPRRYYSPGSMNVQKLEKFRVFYRENFRTPFLLSKEIDTYCRSDCQILISAMIAYRKMNLELCGIDMLFHAVTAASASMLIYRAKFMPENTIGVCRELGYEPHTRQSSIALKFIKWYAHAHNLDIQHRDSSGGEIKCGPFSIDAVIKRGAGLKPIAGEINGCHLHGCQMCYEDEDELPNGQTAAEARRIWHKRLLYIQKYYDVHTIWTCEIERLLKSSASVREFFDQQHDGGPILPREAFRGGRVGPASMYYKVKDDEEICVMDVVSMYPFVQFTTPYPIKHPEVIVCEKDVCWTRGDDVEYRGLIKCLVLPPRNMLQPILAYNCAGYMTFPLCRTCTNNALLKKKRVHACQHSENERSFVYQGTDMELRLALDNGYKVSKFYRAYHYTSFSTDLFKGYVRTFMRLKMLSKPCKIQCPEERQRFVDEIRAHLGIEIDPAAMTDNPGMYWNSKQNANSNWGRFGIKNVRSSTNIVSTPNEMTKLFCDKKLKVLRVEELMEDIFMVVTQPVECYVRTGPASNLIVAIWTTSAARIILYKAIKTIMDTPGCRYLYGDTDSVFFVKKRANPLPLTESSMLGGWEREYRDKLGVEWLCMGNKNYCLVLLDPLTNEYTFVMKTKGITLDADTCAILTYEQFKSMVFEFGEQERSSLTFTYSSIRPDKRGRVLTRVTKKRHRAFFEKGHLNSLLEVEPFGYCK